MTAMEFTFAYLSLDGVTFGSPRSRVLWLKRRKVSRHSEHLPFVPVGYFRPDNALEP